MWIHCGEKLISQQIIRLEIETFHLVRRLLYVRKENSVRPFLYVSRYFIPLLLSRERWASWTKNHMWYDISSFTRLNWWILRDSFNFQINVCSLVMLSCFAVVHRTPRWSMASHNFEPQPMSPAFGHDFHVYITFLFASTKMKLQWTPVYLNEKRRSHLSWHMMSLFSCSSALIDCSAHLDLVTE